MKNLSLFTELNASEEANLSGGGYDGMDIKPKGVFLVKSGNTQSANGGTATSGNNTNGAGSNNVNNTSADGGTNTIS